MARTLRSTTAAAVVLLAAVAFAPPASAAPLTDVPAGPCAGAPWMDRHRSPDERAAALLPQLTLDEKMQMMHTVSDATHSREVLANSCDGCRIRPFHDLNDIRAIQRTTRA